MWHGIFITLTVVVKEEIRSLLTPNQGSGKASLTSEMRTPRSSSSSNGVREGVCATTYNQVDLIRSSSPRKGRLWLLLRGAAQQSQPYAEMWT